MKIEIKVTEEEVRKLVADYLSKMFGITVPASEITSGRYSSGEYTLGQYGGFEYPPIPKNTEPKEDTGKAEAFMPAAAPAPLEVETVAAEPPF